MSETTLLGQRLRQLEQGEDRFRILDVEHSSVSHRVNYDATHLGVYYLLPPSTATADEVVALMEEFKARDAIHFHFHAQRSLGVEHQPILTPDDFARKHFEKPRQKLVKVQWGHRRAALELLEILDELKSPFSRETFPRLGDISLANYKAPQEGRETKLSVRLRGNDWKTLNDAESDIKIYIAEANLPREIYVSRHRVQGLAPEVILASTEASTAKAHRFLADLAECLPEATDEEVPVTVVAPSEPGSEVTFAQIREQAAVKKRERGFEEIRGDVLAAVLETLETMPGFRGIDLAIRGDGVEAKFPASGMLGLGGHFDRQHRMALRSVYRTLRGLPQFREGWDAAFSYDRALRVLRVRVLPPGSEVPGSFEKL